MPYADIFHCGVPLQPVHVRPAARGVAHARLLCIHGHPVRASQVCHDYDPERNGIINSLNSCFPNSTTLHCPLDDAREWLCISLTISTVGQESMDGIGQLRRAWFLVCLSCTAGSCNAWHACAL